MKRTIWIPVMIAALACVLAQTGCWKTDSNPTAPQITSEPLSKPLAQSVRFKLTFPASVKGSPRSLILGETSQIEPKAAIVASENTTPTVTFKLILINIGNASTPTTILSKTVPVDASGSAQTSFNSIPAQTVIGDIHIEGGHISGFSDFHGATDLLAQVENIVELSPKNSNTQPDVIATIIEQILSSELLFPKASTELASKIKTSLEGLDLSTSTIYEDALNQFVNQTMVQASNMTLATNSVVMDSTSMSSLSGLSSIMNEGPNQLTFTNPSPQLLLMKPGNVLVGEANDLAVNGIIQKIVSISSSGNTLTFETTEATIEEAIQDCSIEYFDTVNEMPLPRMGSKRSFIGEVGTLISFKDSLSIKNAAKVDYDFSIKPKVLIKIDIKNHQLKEFVISFDVNEQCKIIVSTSVAASFSDFYETSPRWIKTIWLSAGGVPIPILLYGSIYARIDGSANAGLKVGFEQSLDASIGARRLDGQWSMIKRFESSFSPVWDPQFNLDIKFSVGPKLYARPYGAPGPWVILKGIGRLEVSPNQRFMGSIGGEVGASLKVTKDLKIEEKFNLDSAENLLWEKKQAVNLKPVIKITDPADNSEISVGSIIKITADARDDDGSITEVRFSQGEKVLQTATKSPFTCTFSPSEARDYVIKAQATDNAGDTETSQIMVIVKAPIVGPLGPPTIIGPGETSAPGSVIATLTPLFSWSGVSGATEYGLYIRDIQTGILVYDSADPNKRIPPGKPFRLPQDYLIEGKSYRWNMTTFVNQVESSPSVDTRNFQTFLSTTLPGGFFLAFPLPNRDPFSVKINSVFDHSMSTAFQPDGKVISFTGERGDSAEKSLGATFNKGTPQEVILYGFKNSNGNNFVVNGNYAGAGEPAFLFYDGHPGYDFKTTDQSPDGKINVLAAADGIVSWVAGSKYNTLIIDHGNGFTSHYLHLYNRSAIDGAKVSRGDVIAIAGEEGSSGAPHLHFEVRYNGIEIDPYGWKGSYPDPYTRAKSVNLWAPPTQIIPPSPISPGQISPPNTTETSLPRDFKWTPVGGAEKYGLYILELGSNVLVYNPSQNGKTNGTSVSLSSNIIQNGKRYKWDVTAFSSTGESGHSTPFYFQTSPAPDTMPPSITNLSVSNITPNSVTISWTTDEDSTTQVEFWVPGGSRGQPSLNKMLTKSHSIMLTSLRPATTYNFTITSADASSNKRTSNSSFTTATAVVPPLGDFGSPLAGNPEWDPNPPPGPAIRLTWGSVSGAVYDIYRNNTKIISNWNYTYILNNKGLTPGQDYTYFIRAKNSAGATRDSNAITKTAPNPPVPTPPTLIGPGTPTDSNSPAPSKTPTFSWNAVSNASGYSLYVSEYPYGEPYIRFSTSAIRGWETSFSRIPSGKLLRGKKYRWNMTAVVGGIQSNFSGKLYFKAP